MSRRMCISVKGNLLRRFIGCGNGLGQRVRPGRYAQHTPAAGEDLSLFPQLGARVKHMGRFRGFRQPGNGIARLIMLGISAGCQHHAAGRAGGELHFRLRQRSLHGACHNGQQVAFQQGQHHLGLRVAEAAVVLDDLGALGA